MGQVCFTAIVGAKGGGGAVTLGHEAEGRGGKGGGGQLGGASGPSG